MTMEVEFTGPAVRLPEPATLFGHIENELRQQAGVTRDRVVNSMRGEIPHRSGRTAAATTGRVSQIKGGFSIKVRNNTNAHHLRFLQTGTGRYGPRKRKIPKRQRGIIMSGGYRGPPSGRGMRSQDTMRKMMKAPWRDVMPKAIEQMRAAWQKATTATYGRGDQ